MSFLSTPGESKIHHLIWRWLTIDFFMIPHAVLFFYVTNAFEAHSNKAIWLRFRLFEK